MKDKQFKKQPLPTFIRANPKSLQKLDKPNQIIGLKTEVESSSYIIIKPTLDTMMLDRISDISSASIQDMISKTT